MHIVTKRIGVALAALMILSAIAASSALAGTGVYGSGSYAATVTVAPVSATQIITAGTKSYTCSTDKETGVLGEKGQASLSTAPSLAGCTRTGIFEPAVYSANGCTYKRTIGTLSSATNSTASELASCPAGKHVTFTVYENEAQQKAEKPWCAYELGDTPSSQSIGYTDLGSGSTSHVSLVRDVTYPATVLVGTSTFCGANVGGSTTVRFKATSDLTSRDAVGVQNGLAIGAGDLFLEGAQSESPETQPRFNASWLPATSSKIVGTQTTAHVFNFANFRTVSCNASYESAAAFASATNDIGLNVVYSNCVDTQHAGVVGSVYNCYEHLAVENSGPPYVGAITPCPTTIKLFENATKQSENKPMCVYETAGQYATTSLSSVSNGIFSGVTATWSNPNVGYTVTTGGKVICGFQSSMPLTFSGGVSVYGF